MSPIDHILHDSLCGRYRLSGVVPQTQTKVITIATTTMSVKNDLYLLYFLNNYLLMLSAFFFRMLENIKVMMSEVGMLC